MSLKVALHQYLAAQSAITSLVPAARIFRSKRNAGSALPAITYFQISGMDINHQTAASGMYECRIQFDVWASTDSGAEAIMAALRGELHTLQATTIGSGANATVVHLVTFENTMDKTDWPRDGSDVYSYNISTDAVIKYQTTVPTF
jgi:hypothetical protein